MNPSSMKWIPQETNMAEAHGSPDEKKIFPTPEPISFCAAKFRYANASSLWLSVEVLSSNGSNCACGDSSSRLSSRTEIGLWNARNLRDVAATIAGLPFIVDVIQVTLWPSAAEAFLMPEITRSAGRNHGMPDKYEEGRIKLGEFSCDSLNSNPEFTYYNSAEQSKMIINDNESSKSLMFTKKDINEHAFPTKRISTSGELNTLTASFISNTTEIQSYKQGHSKPSLPQPTVGENELISVNSSTGSFGVEGIILFRLKGISEHGQGGPNAISRRAWKANVSQSHGQSLAESQVSATRFHFTAADWQSSASDCQVFPMDCQSFVSCWSSHMDCQQPVKNCNPSESAQLSDIDRQSSTRDWQSSTKNLQSLTTRDWQSSDKGWLPSAKDWQSSALNLQSWVKNWQSLATDLQSLIKDWQSPSINWQSTAMDWQSSAKASEVPSVSRQRTASRRSSQRLAVFRALLTFLLLTGLNFGTTSAKIRSRANSDPVSNIRHVLPELELGNNSVTDVRFNEGSTAFLPCRFPTFPRHHENRVSWIRRWDWHILTAGVFTYTNDDRFVVLHKDGTNDWTLQIKFLQTQDNGTYECQGSALSIFRASIVLGFRGIYPNMASISAHWYAYRVVHSSGNARSYNFIEQSLEPPVYVMWLHGGVPVNYAPDRPRLNVDLIVKGSTSRSILSVKNAKYSDSGNYTCTAPNAINAWVLVYVTQGDTVAAVQRRQPNSSRSVTPEVDGAPALPSKTNAASPLINLFVIPFSWLVTDLQPELISDQSWSIAVIQPVQVTHQPVIANDLQLKLITEKPWSIAVIQSALTANQQLMVIHLQSYCHHVP
ncbi:Immunoglobulin V-set domain [Trinorchestia longiramus]|nr:Immunoglobulin V-set domain [Trinorchestia longiramus]